MLPTLRNTAIAVFSALIMVASITTPAAATENEAPVGPVIATSGDLMNWESSPVVDPVAMSLEELMAYAADHPEVLFRLPVSVTTTESSGIYAGPRSWIAAVEAGLPGNSIQAHTTCGWANTKFNFRVGLWTAAWQKLRTDWCWNGTRIVGTPLAEVTAGITVFGALWGVGWKQPPRVTTSGWMPRPKTYRITSSGMLEQCAVTGVGCIGTWTVWIRHDMRHNGTVSKASGS